MLRFHRGYFLIAVILFVVELLIALYLNDAIIRPYVGDLLVVMLIYTFVMSFFNLSVVFCAMGVLLFAYVVEFSQYLKLINHLGLNHSRAAQLILGTSFAWTDMLAYTVGVLIIIGIERWRNSSPR